MTDCLMADRSSGILQLTRGVVNARNDSNASQFHMSCGKNPECIAPLHDEVEFSALQIYKVRTISKEEWGLPLPADSELSLISTKAICISEMTSGRGRDHSNPIRPRCPQG